MPPSRYPDDSLEVLLSWRRKGRSPSDESDNWLGAPMWGGDVVWLVCLAGGLQDHYDEIEWIRSEMRELEARAEAQAAGTAGYEAVGE